MKTARSDIAEVTPKRSLPDREMTHPESIIDRADRKNANAQCWSNHARSTENRVHC
ncbi:hypothetical protein [Chamaesiphon sp. GL140_3_metabinner_50]|uniref:hypothetical protein n=1 Tax=Chamaesiphon sp. GL140_3_metabinner_50 TaxID=2970812 RepID=UPI0025E388FC|nr:hypothetical protein [Chamaesiphon sp. GL140_3_metabinner_50]